MIFIDQTILPLALPTIQREFLSSDLTLQWIVNSYFLSMTAFVLLGGRLSDVYGQRKIYCLGLLVFAIASAFGGLAIDSLWLIGARIFQGIGSALMTPATFTIIIQAFPKKMRGRAMGIYVSAGTFFLAIGPFVGGAFTEFLTWRLLFWINLPIAIVGVILTLLYVPKCEGHKEKISYLNAFFFALGISMLIISLQQRETGGFSKILDLGLFAIGVFCLIAFYFHDRESEHPFIDFTLFKNVLFQCGNVVLFFIQFVLMVTVFWSLFFQNILNYSPMQTGLITLISTFPILGIAPLGGYLADRIGLKWPVVMGLGLIFFCFGWFLIFNRVGTFWLFLPALLAFGCGAALVYTPISSYSIGAIAEKKRGVAAGILNTFRFLGASIGLAILGSILNGTEDHVLQKKLSQNVETEHLTVDQLEGLLAKTKNALSVLKEFSKSAQQYIVSSAKLAFFDGFFFMHFVAMLLIGCVLVYAFFQLKDTNHEED